MPPTPLVYRSGCRRFTRDDGRRSDTEAHFFSLHGSQGRSPSSSWYLAIAILVQLLEDPIEVLELLRHVVLGIGLGRSTAPTRLGRHRGGQAAETSSAKASPALVDTSHFSFPFCRMSRFLTPNVFCPFFSSHSQEATHSVLCPTLARAPPRETMRWSIVVMPRRRRLNGEEDPGAPEACVERSPVAGSRAGSRIDSYTRPKPTRPLCTRVNASTWAACSFRR